MDVEGVFVSFNVNENTFRASGILLNGDLVLVPGYILLPFIQEEEWASSFLKSNSTELKQNLKISDVLIQVFVEQKSKKRDTQTNFLVCRILGVWRSPAVSESVNKLFSEWTLGDVSVTKEWDISTSDTEMSRELMSVFVLLTPENKQCNKSDIMCALVNLLDILEEPRRGQKIEIVSTPFGNEHFMNSLSGGVVSNVTGVDKCIILSDARTAPGCEGGPIFAPMKTREKGRRLIGLVICPLSWWRGEWVGLTIGINLTPVLKTFINQNDTRISSSPGNNSVNVTDLLPLELVDETVLLIRCGNFWGSGVVLNAATGVIITCSHVVKDDEKVSVLYRRKLWPADVIFRSRNDVAYDLAVLRVENSIFRKEVEFSEQLAEIGDEVFAAGFPFFSEKDDANIKPSIVHGSISKVNSFMIQTTCCIQSGFSGGALFKNGKLLGIIVSNVRDSSAGAYFPHINFIIPSSVFRNPILKYIRQHDTGSLNALESSSSRVQMLWKLQASKL